MDELGNEYEATYPKRAKGLVKNGRARSINENKICLLCPPNTETEDNEMSENIDANNTVNENTSNCPIPPISKETTDFLTLQYILEQVEKIRSDTDYLNNAFVQLNGVKSGGAGDVGAAEVGKAFGKMVEQRETTNRQMLSFYEKMYDDIVNPNRQKLSLLEKFAEFGSGDAGALAEKGFIMDSIKEIIDSNL